MPNQCQNVNVDAVLEDFAMRFLLTLCAAAGALGATSWIAPGAVWYDTDGQKIDAHGGGIVQRGDTFYWVGQSASSSKRSMSPRV